MKLLDLPLELLQEIMKRTVFTMGFSRAFRLRVVSKVFDCETLRAIFATQLIQTPPRRRLDLKGCSIVSRYLTARTLADATGGNALITAIRHTADTLINEREQHSLEWDWSQLIHVLCSAATTSMGEIVVVENLNTGSTKTSVTENRSRDTLAAAAHTGRIARVRSMIEEGIRTSARSKYFGTPLEAAASGGHIEIVGLLLENNFDHLTYLRPFLRRGDLDTALRAASTAGHEDILRLLLNSKYGFRVSGSGYHHAACGAARMGHADIVRFLLERIEMLTRPSSQKMQRMILLTASEHGHEVIVQRMLELGIPANLRRRSFDDHQPIHKAAARGHNKVVQLLLGGGAKQSQGKYGSPLHEAARGGFVKVAQTLIDHGADIDACAWAGAPWESGTPIVSAVTSEHAHMVRFLIEKGANLGLDKSGQLALYYAARNGQETMVRLLVECGVPVNNDVREELNPLLNAILEGQDQVAKVLVELGARRMDPLESKYVKERAHCLAEGRFPYSKAGKSYDESMLNYQRLDKALFPSESPIRSPSVATSML